jgi:hypothetical protein
VIPKLAESGRATQFPGVPETMESARRWSGFVCPDCRFVFRVPREHDGRGVVCPSCRRLLKIPTPDDVTPPLVVPLPAGASDKGQKKRRKGRSRRRNDHDWENTDDESRESSRRTRRQMTWMLVGGTALFALIVAGVLMTMMGGGNAPSVVPPPIAQLPAQPQEKAADAPFSDVAFLAAAEPLAEKFLSATSVADLLPLVRNPQLTGPRLKSMYPDGKITAPGMRTFNPASEVIRAGQAMTVKVLTGELDEKPMAFFMTPDGLKIDWESWIGWSEMPWDEFLATKPVKGKLFRVWLSPVDYYNFDFTDDLKWQSYLFESPDGERAVYGYVERGSVLDNRLRPSPDVEKTPLTVTLSFPENATSRNQVLVGKVLAEGWTLETGESP